ncbi:AmmeMemoRadiSam system protein B [Patescibacteria group bacterium]|nr:AmmeMemoRadiSam system protein B [Patescibacteria group bacterium]
MNIFIMLCFAAIAPHPPIIIPTIGRDNLETVKKTVRAMEKLSLKFSQAQPEVVIIISPHGEIFPDAFSLNLSQEYLGSFKNFGDLATRIKFKGDLELIYKIKERFETSSPLLPLTMITEPNLDHGTLVPLYYLIQKLKNFSIIPISYSLLDYQKHLDFGQRLKEEIVLSNKKVAVIASGDLSHRLTKKAPGGYSPQGKTFDQELIKLIKSKKTDQILKLDQNLIDEAGECGLRSIIILLGILKDLNYQPEILSYEGPFGVGYLVANFKFN